jgi:hypothetical protein
MKVVYLQVLPASGAFLLDLDGLLDAARAEDMATHCCGRLLQLVPTHWAGKDWFLWSHFRRLFSSFDSFV